MMLAAHSDDLAGFTGIAWIASIVVGTMIGGSKGGGGICFFMSLIFGPLGVLFAIGLRPDVDYLAREQIGKEIRMEELRRAAEVREMKAAAVMQQIKDAEAAKRRPGFPVVSPDDAEFQRFIKQHPPT